MGKSFIDRDKVMHKDEFYKLNKGDRRSLMAHWRQAYTTEFIKQEMGLSNTSFYRLLKRLDLPTSLQEYRDNQPSLLDTSSEPHKIPSEPLECEVRVVARVGLETLSELLKIVQEHDELEITIM
jgi:hypothetical protein